MADREVYFGENEENEEVNTTEYRYENNNYNAVSNNSENENKPKVPTTPFEILVDLINKNDLKGVAQFITDLKAQNTKIVENIKRQPVISLAILNIDTRSKETPSNSTDTKTALKILETLLENQFLPTELSSAAKIENETISEVVLKLLILKANMNVNGGKTEESPLLYALELNHFKVADFLIKADADKNKVVAGVPLLHKVIFGLKNLKAAQFLLDKGANVNQQDLVGDTVLHSLLKADLPETYQEAIYTLLLKNPFLSPRTPDGLGRHPLLSAVYQGNLYGVERLIHAPRDKFKVGVTIPQVSMDRRNGRLPNAEANQYKTPLLIALIRSSLSPPTDEKNVKKESVYNKILIELIVNSDLRKYDWTSIFADMDQIGVPVSGFCEQILYQKQFRLLDYFMKNKILDINSLINKDDTYLTFSLKGFETDVIDSETVKTVLDLGANPNTPNRSGATPMLLAYQSEKKEIIQLLERYGGTRLGIFIAACQMGIDELVIQLLKDGENPTQTIKIDGKDYTGYDLASSMKIKLLLAPYFDKEDPKFEGFKTEDFQKFENIFIVDETVELGIQENGICPICFVSARREDGCLYMRDHNCKQLRELLKARGQFIHIHEKLYEAYNENGLIKYCVLCNRFTTDRTGSHRHYSVGSPIPVKKMIPPILELGVGAGYYDKTCYKNGGGDQVEKVYRLQELLKFMCHLNKKYIGKISQNMAYNLIKENFIGSAMPYAKFFTSYQAVPRDEKEREVVQLRKDIIKNKKFFMPEGCGPVEGEVGSLKVKNKANIPRPPQNADLFPKVLKQQAFDPATIEGPPEPPQAPPRGAEGYAQLFIAYQKELAPYRQLKRAYNENMDTLARKCAYHNERHSDGRDLYQFFHRQTDGEIYDHEDSLICKEGLLEYLNFLISNPKAVTCFDDTNCDGYFHPLEVKDLMVTDEEKKIYENYKIRFNNNPPNALGGQGGGANTPKRFTSLFFEDPTEGDLPKPCPLSPYQKLRKGGKRKTRKLRKVKAKQFRRTRKH
jgi:ankyrin repeat protein